MRNFLLCLMAAVALTSCDKGKDITNNVDDTGIKDYFGEVVEIEVDETNVTILATMPRMTVDGYDNPKAKIKLGYEARMGEMVGEEQFESEYGIRNGLVVFKLYKLAPMTEYAARIYIEDERYDYSAVSEDFTFGTAKKDPKCEFDYDLNIESRGLFATITLDNMSYTADGEPHPLRSIELEYRRHGYINEERVKVEYDAESIVDGRLVMELPSEGNDYLAYSTMYQYSIRVLPEQSLIPEEPVYGDVVMMGDFTTSNAEIEVDFSTPLLSLEIFDELDGVENVGDSRITAKVDKVDIFYDGVASEDYNPEYRRYDEAVKLCYRQKGSEEWMSHDMAKTEEGGFETRFIVDNPESDTIYEVGVVVYAGSDRSVGHYSDIAEINVRPSSVNQ